MRNIWFVVLAMGIWTTSTLIAKSDMTLEEDIERINSRAPANIAASVAGPGTFTGLEAITIKCGENAPAEFVTKSRHIRIVALSCASQPSILNQRSGGRASLFSTGKREYTTEYFRLENGANDIAVRIGTNESVLHVIKK